MSEPPQGEKFEEKFDPFAGPFEQARMAQYNRRERIIREILAYRRGEYRVPTWVLVVALVAMIAGILAVLIFA